MEHFLVRGRRKKGLKLGSGLRIFGVTGDSGWEMKENCIVVREPKGIGERQAAESQPASVLNLTVPTANLKFNFH
jgi:hypothetical protein